MQPEPDVSVPYAQWQGRKRTAQVHFSSPPLRVEGHASHYGRNCDAIDPISGCWDRFSTTFTPEIILQNIKQLLS